MDQPSLFDCTQVPVEPKPVSKRLKEFMKGRNPANYLNETDYFAEPSGEVKAFIRAGCNEILDEMNERIDRTIATLTREGNWPYVPGVLRPDSDDDQ
jgi:DNA helicase TIP49 (TBP-interacting protein)